MQRQRMPLYELLHLSSSSSSFTCLPPKILSPCPSVVATNFSTGHMLAYPSSQTQVCWISSHLSPLTKRPSHTRTIMALLKNVVGIVSGGASGLGAATAAHIVRNGGRVVVADLASQHESFLRLATASCAEAAVAAADTTGSSPVLAFAETDVTNEDQVSAALDLAESQFGEPVNVAVSCAGIGTARKVLSRPKEGDVMPRVHSLEEFSKTIQVNTVGTFNVARLAAQRMAVREPDGEGMRGCIIQTASIAGFDGQCGQVAYGASKSAVIGMTLPMARDLAQYGIRVMTVAPGLFKTPLLEGLPEKVQAELGQTVPCPSRLGDPEEFGRLVGSILTNPMLNGETIRLDGALRMPP